MGRDFLTRKLPIIAAVLAAGTALAGCTATEPSGDDAARNAAYGVLDPGFLGGAVAPSPEATIDPAPGSWDGVAPGEGFEVVVISKTGDAPAETLSAGVGTWASSVGATVDSRVAADDDEVERMLNDAVAAAPDLVVGVGAGIVDVFTLLTAQHLDQQFLVTGAQLPEPTGNVTSVIWPGASFRGTGISTEADTDTSAITPERAQEAVAAGVASVLHGYVGIVINLPEG